MRDVFDALLELAQPKTYQCTRCHVDTCPERFEEEVHCWQCKYLTEFLVGPEVDP